MASELTLSSRLAFSPDALDREVGERVLILHHVSGDYFALDPVASRMWLLLRESGGSVRAVFETTVEEYDVSADELAADLLRLLGDLRAKGVLELAP